jgi:hypothetical protein
MLVDRLGSSVDLVKRMQPGGDLENAWLLFDQVKRVQEWTTMACHVYEATYYKVLTIAVSRLSLWTSFRKTRSERCRLDMFGRPHVRAHIRDCRLLDGVVDGTPSGGRPWEPRMSDASNKRPMFNQPCAVCDMQSKDTRI